ncbi:MAG: 16S rRNA (uracil(1498)-N(3))-methyltransferase [Lachnospiraceae bacterium]|nr:16S rRNA (uracil(1498)-N(3))-methyltransferase [Lachnospiraceae bacterium]
MTHIFVDPAEVQGDVLHITGSDYNHIRNVLRMKPGEEISVSTGADGREYRFGIEEITDEQILCRLRFVKEANVELPVKVILFQGLPKADKMDLIVQKAVELGVFEIVPVETARAVVKLDEGKKTKRRERWQKIAESAAQQCRRGIVPAVRDVMTFQEALAYAGIETDRGFIPYELQESAGTRELVEQVKPDERIALFIGPEGGFTPEEVKAAQERRILPISLGRRILRTETAAMTFLSWMIYTFEV